MSKASRRGELHHSTSRTLAAVVGTVPLALSVGIALAVVLPLPFAYRLPIGVFSVFPVWTLATTLAFLTGGGKRCWARVVVATLVAALTAVIAFVLRGGGTAA